MIFELDSSENAKSDEVSFELIQSETKPLPSIVQAPKLDLKQLPSHLKYVYLGTDETLPVIVSSKLTKLEEEKLTRILREYKEAIG